MKKIYKYLNILLFLLTCSIFLSMPVKADGITTVQVSGTRDYDIAKEICNIVNTERANNGLSPVKLNMQLTEAAMKRAEELAVYYSHTRPSGESCWSVSNIAMAENIAIGYASASDVMNGWMNSSGHRANILTRDYSGIGVGVFTNGHCKYYVQMFTPYSTTEEETFAGKRQVTPTINILESNLNLTLRCSNSNLQEGQEATLSLYNINKGYTFYSAELNAAGVTWNVSDPNVLSVNNGKVTAKKAGTATVSAIFGTKSVSVTITVQHAWNTNYTVIKEATCEEPGEKVLLCKICGAENTASKTMIPVKSHQWSNWTVTKEASCEADGQKKRSCSACGKSETETIAKTGIHQWNNWIVTKEASCETDGQKKRSCSACGKSETETIAKTGIHKWSNWIVTKEASCETDGQKKRSCSACGKSETETIAKTGIHQWNNWIVTKEASCETDGQKKRSCSACGKSETETIAKTGIHKWSNWTVTKEASCETDGQKKRSCSVCGKSETETIAKTGVHKWSSWKVIKEASCEADGQKKRSCSVCGKSETETIAKTGIHKWRSWTVTKEATCETDGQKKRNCSVCGKSETETIAKTGIHKWRSWTVTKEATCETDGQKKRSCSVCGESETETIAKTGIHKWRSWTVIKEATCETDGQKKRSCSVCGESETETIAKTGIHKWGSWTVIKEATVLENGIRERICQECQRHEEENIKNVIPTGKLNMTKIYLRVNQVSKDLKVTGMKEEDGIASYTSSNKKIFIVDKYGKIKGKGKGSATLKVTLKSGKKLYAKVYVQTGTVKTTKLQVNKKVVTLKKGKTFTLKTVVAPLTSQQEVTFATTKKSVATVNKYGKITAKKQGTAYIVVRSGSKKVTVKVIVK